jgi:4-amino-4-deoxy-L-arabinose transferase-like glycosyltransferase
VAHLVVSRFAFWRSPADQPRWARPALLALTVLAGFAYGWHMGSSIEIYYAAAVRSMSMSWHDFAYAAFDPAGTISVDKLPGAFWVQALSVRLFGVHTWAIALPQVVEGLLTVLVLYRTVRRLAGPVAALIGAAVLAGSPATVALNRGNISDTLLVLLLVLAADAAVAALTTGRRWHIAMAGIWVGLAFQAKMVEAWLVVPALAAMILVASAGTPMRRMVQVAAMVVVMVVVSFSWMTFVTLTPAAHRPYVDGGHHDSVFEQVFDYNGFGRVGQPSPNVEAGRTLDIPFLATPAPRPTWNRLLAGPYGRDSGWLLLASVMVIALGFGRRRRCPRSDVMRAGIILWGTWLLVFAVVFTVSSTIMPYYLGALTPAVAGLMGIGAKLVWEARARVTTQVVAGVAVLATAVFAFWLLPGAGTGLPPWLRVTVLVCGIAFAAALALSAALASPRLTAAALIGLGVVVISVPLVASESVVTNTLGPFDTPFQPVATTQFTRSFFGAPLQSISTLPALERARGNAPDLIATQTALLAATFIYATGQEVLPIGGFTGSIPEPTVKQLAALVASGAFHVVLTAVRTHDPRTVWVAHHCLKLPTPAAKSDTVLPVTAYYCAPPG